MCKECEIRGKTWEGSDPTCAFNTDVFNSENWNCATMNKLRSICYDKGFYNRDDNASASIGVLTIPESDDAYGYLIMTWYKSRGKVGKAVVMCDDEEPHILTLKESEAIIKSYLL